MATKYIKPTAPGKRPSKKRKPKKSIEILYGANNKIDQYGIDHQIKVINTPSLPQSCTHLVDGRSDTSTSDQSIITYYNKSIASNSDMHSMITTATISVNEPDDSDSEDSSSSSDWDAQTIISTVSTVLPPRHKKHQTMDITPYFSQQFVIDDIAYEICQLFYPFTNLQSLLFSQLQPYIESDYKKLKTMASIDSTETDENGKMETEQKHNVQMNWKNEVSVNKIKALISKLLCSSSTNQSIKEEDFYLMFTSPSPSEIIQQLRFGSLSDLCDVHLDRFGRRYFHYKNGNNETIHKRERSELHFYNHSSIPSSMFGAGDMIGLSNFIEEDIKSPGSPLSDNESVTSSYSSYSSISANIAKMHYHDNDTVMVTSNKNGKMETEVQWQNYAIHSYFRRNTNTTRTRVKSIPTATNNSSITASGIYNVSKVVKNKKNKQNILRRAASNIGNKNVNNMPMIGQYGRSKIPHIFKTSKMSFV